MEVERRTERGRWMPAVAAAACALGLLAGCAHRGARPPGPEIERLEVVGNEHVKSGEIRDRMVTDSPSWIPFTARPHLDPPVWTADVARVKRFYQSKGYYQAEVTEQVEEVGRHRVDLTLRISEGRPTHVRSVQVVGLEPLPLDQREEVLDSLSLHEGDVFVEDAFESAAGRIRRALRGLGYAEARAEGHATVDLATQEASVRIEVEPGIRYRFDGVVVSGPGAGVVEPWRIEELVHEATESHEYFSPKALNEAQSRIVGLGVFGAVRVTQGKGDPQTGTIPVNVNVTEAPLRELALGFGLGIEQLRYSANAVARFNHYNFLGRLRYLSVNARVGWAIIPTAFASTGFVSRSGPIGLLSGQIRQPRLFHPNLSLNTQAELERDIEPAFSFYGGRGRVGVPWHPVSWFVFENSYHFELYLIDRGVDGVTEGAPLLLLGCGHTCAVSYLEQAIAVDRRDDRLEPKAGYYLGLSFQEGGGPLGGTFNFVRVLPEVRGYVTVLPNRRLTFSGRLRVGTLLPINGGTFDSPIVTRFFSGGDSMRGFSVQRLSPARLTQRVTGNALTLEPVPIGGNGLFESSLEARYALTQLLTVATFVDAGFVTSESIRARLSYFTENMQLAVGAGVRYRTPVGPVRLDLAYRPNIGPPLPVFVPPSNQPIFLPGSGCFGFGKIPATRAGAPEGPCAIHLSVGEAF